MLVEEPIIARASMKHKRESTMLGASPGLVHVLRLARAGARASRLLWLVLSLGAG